MEAIALDSALVAGAGAHPSSPHAGEDAGRVCGAVVWILVTVLVSSAATSISLMPPSSSRRKSVQRDAPAEGTAARTVKLKGLISITPVA